MDGRKRKVLLEACSLIKQAKEKVEKVKESEEFLYDAMMNELRAEQSSETLENNINVLDWTIDKFNEILDELEQL